MAVNFTLLNYHTRFESFILDKNNNRVKNDVFKQQYACFARMYNLLPYKNSEKVNREHDIYICTSENKCYHIGSNYCPFSVEQISEWLACIKMFIPKATLYLEKCKDTTFPYKVVIKHKGTPIEHKFLTTSIRYLYEYPYNFILWDAFKLKNTKGFRRENLLSLVIFVQSSFYNVGCVHSLGYCSQCCKKINKSNLKISDIKSHTRCNDLFNHRELDPIPSNCWLKAGEVPKTFKDFNNTYKDRFTNIYLRNDKLR